MKKGSFWDSSFWFEYGSVLWFAIKLTVCVLLSYSLAHFIPVSFYVTSLSTILHGCTATVSLLGAILVLRHNGGIHVRFVWAGILLVWTVLSTLFLTHVIDLNNVLLESDSTISNRGVKLIVGNLYAWILLFYPTAVIRPGYLSNVYRAFYPLLPMIAIAVIDYLTPFDLSWALAIYPMIAIMTLGYHIRKYRQWCEEHYASMENIDVQWIWKYIFMYLISGICYTVLSFSYTSAHAFTQQWLLLFVLAYSTEQILYRQDPWNLIRRTKSLPPEPEELPDEGGPNELLSAYRAKLEEWMEKEKPYTNAEFRLMDLRQVLPLNRTYLSLLINEEYGCTFYQFVTNYRIAEAKRLMRTNPYIKMHEVAERSGFSSAVVFSRIFSRETGMTPSEWKNQMDNS